VYPRPPAALRCVAMRLERSVRGAAAGAVGAAVWAAQEPLDKRVFGVEYSDVELLGKAVTRGDEWPAVGLAIHVANGAAFGAAYALAKPFLPGPPIARALIAGMVENFGSWPLIGVAERIHPARRDLPKLAGNRRALAQATWRHVLFAVVLGVLEERLNQGLHVDVPEVPVSSNGHGDIELAVGAAT
jgi:hypothetical protein